MRPSTGAASPSASSGYVPPHLVHRQLGDLADRVAGALTGGAHREHPRHARPQDDTVSVTVRTTDAAGDTIQAVAFQGTQQVGSAQGSPAATLTMSVPDARLWSPNDPYLYGLTVRLTHGGRPIDTVGSYFGMRSISVASVGGVARVELNGQPTFMLGTLDQGYWPDGGYTAPTPRPSPTTCSSRRRSGSTRSAST